MMVVMMVIINVIPGLLPSVLGVPHPKVKGAERALGTRLGNHVNCDDDCDDGGD